MRSFTFLRQLLSFHVYWLQRMSVCLCVKWWTANFRTKVISHLHITAMHIFLPRHSFNAFHVQHKNRCTHAKYRSAEKTPIQCVERITPWRDFMCVLALFDLPISFFFYCEMSVTTVPRVGFSNQTFFPNPLQANVLM